MKHGSFFNALVVGLMILAGISTILAQGRRASPEERAKQLKEQLTLNDEQTKKVAVILTESQKVVMAKMEETNGDRTEMREFVMKEMTKVDEKIEKLLTKEQAAKYEEIKKERGQRRPRPQ